MEPANCHLDPGVSLVLLLQRTRTSDETASFSVPLDSSVTLTPLTARGRFAGFSTRTTHGRIESGVTVPALAGPESDSSQT